MMTAQQEKEMYLKQLLANQIDQPLLYNLQYYTPQTANLLQPVQTVDPLQQLKATEELAAQSTQPAAAQPQVNPIQQLQAQQPQAQIDPLAQLRARQAQAQQQVQQNSYADMYERLRDFSTALQMRHNLGELEKLRTEREKVRGDVAAKKLKAQEDRQKKQKELLDQQILIGYLRNKGVPLETAMAYAGNSALLTEFAKQESKDKLYKGKISGEDIYLETEDAFGEKTIGYAPIVGTDSYNKLEREYIDELNMSSTRTVMASTMIDALTRTKHVVEENATATGVMAQLLENVFGTKSADLKALFDHLQGVYIVSTATELKKKYGSIFGQLTEKEVGFILDTLGALSRSQSKEEMLHHLEEIINSFHKIQEIEALDVLPSIFNHMYRKQMLFRDGQANNILIDSFNRVAAQYNQPLLDSSNPLTQQGVYLPVVTAGGRATPVLSKKRRQQIKSMPQLAKMLNLGLEYDPQFFSYEEMQRYFAARGASQSKPSSYYIH